MQNLDKTQKKILADILKDLKDDAELLEGLEGEQVEKFVIKEITNFYRKNI